MWCYIKVREKTNTYTQTTDNPLYWSVVTIVIVILLLLFSVIHVQLPELAFGNKAKQVCQAQLIHTNYICSLAEEQAGTPPQRGLLHIWQSGGPSEPLSPERVLLSQCVLQVALGEHHGLLLAQCKRLRSQFTHHVFCLKRSTQNISIN